MKDKKHFWEMLKNPLIMVATLVVSFCLCLFLQEWVGSQTLIPTFFVLAVILVSLFTDGYFYGILTALISVMAVNYAFTFPYFKLNFTSSENFVSAVIMILVTLIVSALTTKIRKQEILKTENEKVRMRNNLLRAISHDLRTPLTVIYGSSCAILENQDVFTREQTLRMVKGIRSDAKWLIRMVENLLSITKIDGGNVRIIKTPTVLDELIDSVVHKLKKTYPEQQVQLDLPEDFVMVPMDAMLIEQVLMNLLENAIEHAEGMTGFGLRVHTKEDRIVFEVWDDGCGIPDAKIPYILNGLYSVSDVSNKSSDSQKRNMGIGLTVCATIISAHKGELTAGNREDGGAIFRFWLPREDEQDGQQ